MFVFFVVVFGFDQKLLNRLERDFLAHIWMGLVFLKVIFFFIYKSGGGLLIPALRLW